MTLRLLREGTNDVIEVRLSVWGFLAAPAVYVLLTVLYWS